MRGGLAVRRSRPLPAAVDTGEVAAEVDGVSAVLGGATVLDDVTLQARAGEVLGLVGPNGAGKSTLLGVLSGDVRPSRGSVRLAGRTLNDWTNTEAARLRSVLLQQVTLSFPFTVTDVVAMGRAPWAGTPEEAADDVAVAEAMEQTDVTAFASRRFTSLSGGEKARVALARVLAQRTTVMLLDEPTAALDIRHQELVLGVARARAAAGAAVAVVLHDLNLAAVHTDRVAVLSGGRLTACGPPGEVLTSASLSNVYAHDVEVLAHPRAGTPIVLPRR